VGRLKGRDGTYWKRTSYGKVSALHWVPHP